MELTLFDKQAQFVKAQNKINVYAGGIQSGKTTSGAIKMWQSILTFKSQGDNFIIAADTYKTLWQATIPKFHSLVKSFGVLNRSTGVFETNWGTTVYLRTAKEPESMEGITNVRRIWVDEAGKISKYFFENVMGRAAFKQAPIDLTTTPYSQNWLAELCREAQQKKRDDVFFLQCKSIDSPYFPKEEYERQKSLLDPRRFAMKYDGVFGKMEGLVYDAINVCGSFQLPPGTKYYAGIDWGYYPDPFVFVVRALTPEKVHYRVFEYYRTHLTISDIVNVLRGFKSIYPFEMAYCDPSQPAHIQELNSNGIPAIGANNAIRIGIDVHYELIKTKRFWIFKDLNPLGLDEYSTYHYPETRELKIDESSTFKFQIPVGQNDHGCDADRYVSIELTKSSENRRSPKTPHDFSNPPIDLAKRIKWLKAGGSSRFE